MSSLVSLTIHRIDCERDDARAAIAELRRELSPKGNVVSPESRARTIAVFGEPLSPSQVVDKICAEVAARGLAAVFDYTRKLDGVSLDTESVRVASSELEEAYRTADAGYLKTIEHVRENILAYQRAVLPRDVHTQPAAGISLGLRYTPLPPLRL